MSPGLTRLTFNGRMRIRGCIEDVPTHLLREGAGPTHQLARRWDAGSSKLDIDEEQHSGHILHRLE